MKQTTTISKGSKHTDENFHELNHVHYDLPSANTDENFHEPQSVPCALSSKNKDENFYEFNDGHCDLNRENVKENFRALSNIHNNLHRENASETAHESGHVRCQINEILHEEEISDRDNEVAHSYLNHNATETILGENTVHFGPILAYDKNDTITEVLQRDSLRFGEKLSSVQVLNADSEETNEPPHEGKFQITRNDENDFRLPQFATSTPQGDEEHSADMSNPDQVRQESVTPPIFTQLGDQFPADFPPTERSLGSADTLVSCTPTSAESHIAGENREQHNSHINAMDSKVRLPSASLSITGSIQDRETSMLIDTGASVTAVSNAFLSTLPTPPTLQSSLLPSVHTVSGEQLPVRGQATLTFLIGDRAYISNTLVIANLSYPVVLGRDFLTQCDSVIDLKEHTLTLGACNVVPLQCSFPVASSNTEEPISVHACATYILPPLSESVIPVSPKSSLPVGKTGLIEHNPKLAEKYHVCGASQLVSLSEQHTFPFRVLNPTCKPVTIYRCSTMGIFTPSAGSMSVIDIDEASVTPTLPSADDETVPLDLTSSTLDGPQLTQLTALIAEYRDIFALKPEELGRTGLVQHRIDTGDNPPVRQRPYCVSDTQRGIIEEHVDDMLNRGIIQPSTSPWASPIILVKKKDGTDRFVVDFRRLNAVTRKDSFPLPRIDDALDALNGTKYFSSMDLMSGYWQVEMEPESRERTAFITYGGLYEFLVLPFGLTGAPGTFARLMESVLRNLTYKICLTYLDDILVYSKTFEDHLFHFRQVFYRLRLANLKLKPSKCKFACPQVT